MHEADQPDPVADLLDTDLLAGEHGAQVDFLVTVADATTARDDQRAIVERVLGFPKAAVGPG